MGGARWCGDLLRCSGTSNGMLWDVAGVAVRCCMLSEMLQGCD